MSPILAPKTVAAIRTRITHHKNWLGNGRFFSINMRFVQNRRSIFSADRYDADAEFAIAVTVVTA